MGSVKDLVVIEEPEKNKTGKAQFVFSDRYSVFDWGEMPDHIQAKGAAICITTAYFFEKLEEKGIRTHYKGLVEEGEVKRLSELKSPRLCMEIELLRVLKPDIKRNTYDYSIYREEKANLLIPLEIIYRNSLPEGSSVFKRLQEGGLRLADLGLNETPYPGQVLEKPLLDVSTKLEASDRYLSREEAKEIAGLSEDEMGEIERITLLINELITKEARRIGLVNEDGKVEFGFDEDRKLMLVDAVGTLDECRFTYKGMPVSKEIARIFYRNTSWYEEVEEAKKVDNVGWKKLVENKPPLLPPAIKDLISMLYKACCNEITQRIWFTDVPPVKEILNDIREVLPS
ncbi:phosphoribosylaminoimidazolesuccinocarboxamide synthase [Methanosarcinales archaeon]|nr:MAG: phosphoribosylaminoimidazolesuccinocarboxamide synthase [Methanosarcinales archaeon]